MFSLAHAATYSAGLKKADSDVRPRLEAYVVRKLFSSIPRKRLVKFLRQFDGLLNQCIDYILASLSADRVDSHFDVKDSVQGLAVR